MTTPTEGIVELGTPAALYLRVSTTRQAENDLSIPDQRRQCSTYCEAKGWEISREYVEPGASATDDKRPAFQRMIDDACSPERPDDACSPERPFEIILVHSFSRFFRDAFLLEFYVRKLAKHNVRLASISQETGDDPMSAMIRQIMALFDEYQSKENAKHTLRAMKENARQGYWNGSRPPLGYRVVEAGRHGDKIKKRLEIDPREAELVRKIFYLYRFGDGRSGPLGIKAIVNYLNENGFRQRPGTRFPTKTVHEILRRSTYMGRHFFNQTDSKTGKTKPQQEWVEVTVPAIVDAGTFDHVQAQLSRRSPKNTPPRIVNNPTLLTGLAKCATCGGGMVLRTGKGGRYRYYTCATCSRMGKTACKGRSVPMGLLDDLVVDQLSRHVLEPERLKELLTHLAARAANGRTKRQDDAKAMQLELRDTEQRIDRLFDALETGTVTDTGGFRDRLSKLENRRDETMRLLAMTKRELDVPNDAITPGRIDAFATAMRDKLRTGSIAFRKSYLRLFIDRVDVDDDEVRISGSRQALEYAVSNQSTFREGEVPSFVQDWRPQGEGTVFHRNLL